MGLALLTAGLLYGGAPVLAHTMKMPALRGDMRLLCIPFLLEAAAVTGNTRLRRTCDPARWRPPTFSARSLFWWSRSACCGTGCRAGVLPAVWRRALPGHTITVLVAGGKTPLGCPTSAAAREVSHFAARSLADDR